MEKIKVDCYDDIEEIVEDTNSMTRKKGYCLIEYNGEMFLGTTEKLNIETDEKEHREIVDACKKLDELSSVLSIPYDVDKLEVEDYGIKDIKRINPDGTLSKVKRGDFLQKIGEYTKTSATMSIPDNKEEVGLSSEYTYAMNENGKRIKKYNFSKNNIPYGDVKKASIDYDDMKDKMVIWMDGKEYPIDEMEVTDEVVEVNYTEGEELTCNSSDKEDKKTNNSDKKGDASNRDDKLIWFLGKQPENTKKANNNISKENFDDMTTDELEKLAETIETENEQKRSEIEELKRKAEDQRRKGILEKIQIALQERDSLNEQLNELRRNDKARGDE